MSKPETIHSVNRSRSVPKAKSNCCIKPLKTIEGANYGWCSQCRTAQDLSIKQRKSVKPRSDLAKRIARDMRRINA